VTLAIDEESLLVQVEGRATLAEVEGALGFAGLTLDVAGAKGSRETVAAWLAAGADGARDAWLDPADHLLAGLDLRLHDGRVIVVRPAPRRAVGPDLVTLVVGMRERFGRVERAWLRVHRVGVRRADVGSLEGDRDPVLSPGESALLDAIEAALRSPDAHAS
jgi:alkyldihydroxyacetonephosphate synthase